MLPQRVENGEDGGDKSGEMRGKRGDEMRILR